MLLRCLRPPSFFFISQHLPRTQQQLVMCQTRNVVLSFNVTSGRYIRQVIGALNTDGIESIALSDC